jgi:hypothetical protein
VNKYQKDWQGTMYHFQGETKTGHNYCKTLTQGMASAPFIAFLLLDFIAHRVRKNRKKGEGYDN